MLCLSPHMMDGKLTDQPQDANAAGFVWPQNFYPIHLQSCVAARGNAKRIAERMKIHRITTLTSWESYISIVTPMLTIDVATCRWQLNVQTCFGLHHSYAGRYGRFTLWKQRLVWNEFIMTEWIERGDICVCWICDGFADAGAFSLAKRRVNIISD